MKTAYIISTGTELLLGTTIDTNSVFLSQQLGGMGFRVVGKSIVGDNKQQMNRAFELALQCADVVVATGGLGPTFDDLTKTVACELLGCEMVLNEEETTRLKEFFLRRQRDMPEINLKQAMFPTEAVIVKNVRGTAPGMYLKKEGKLLILLPGPPSEMKPMFKDEIIPLLSADFVKDLTKIVSSTIKVLGPGESKVEEMLGDLMEDMGGCSMALLAVDGEIHIKITAEGNEPEKSEKILKRECSRISERLGKYVYGFDEETLPSIVGQLLLKEGSTLALAESCTGGLISKMITDLPGSSQYYWGGANTYSNQSKMIFLGVDESTISTYGAVSPETAEQMARGILRAAGVQYGLAITGIAGPGGGTTDKPVGLVYIALATKDNCQTKELKFVGSRDAVRNLSAKSALDFLRRYLQGK